MAHWKSFYDKEFLYSFDLDGKDITVTIEKVTGGEVIGEGGKKSKKPMLHIVGTKKRLALNVTNGKTIETLYGKDVQNWKGKRVTLFPSTTKFGSETMDCIRVRPKIPGDKTDTPLPDVQPPSEVAQ
jgi:hypothetical protein